VGEFPGNHTVQLFTIGYEGKTIDSFLDRLVETAIDVLVDVRQLPISRKKGFSKTRLQDRLEASGIDYLAMRELGTPKTLRERLRIESDYPSFLAAYRQHLREQQGVLAKLASILPGHSVCLMCYEADPLKCHRAEIVAELRRECPKELEVQHL